MPSPAFKTLTAIYETFMQLNYVQGSPLPSLPPPSPSPPPPSPSTSPSPLLPLSSHLPHPDPTCLQFGQMQMMYLMQWTEKQPLGPLRVWLKFRNLGAFELRNIWEFDWNSGILETDWLKKSGGWEPRGSWPSTWLPRAGPQAEQHWDRIPYFKLVKYKIYFQLEYMRLNKYSSSNNDFEKTHVLKEIYKIRVTQRWAFIGDDDTFAEEQLNSGDLGSSTSINALVARVGSVLHHCTSFLAETNRPV